MLTCLQEKGVGNSPGTGHSYHSRCIVTICARDIVERERCGSQAFDKVISSRRCLKCSAKDFRSRVSQMGKLWLSASYPIIYSSPFPRWTDVS